MHKNADHFEALGLPGEASYYFVESFIETQIFLTGEICSQLRNGDADVRCIVGRVAEILGHGSHNGNRVLELDFGDAESCGHLLAGIDHFL